MNRLLCFIGVIAFHSLSFQTLVYSDEPLTSPLVKVVLDTDFRPEAEFYIAEALRRPPIDWNMMQDTLPATVAQIGKAEDITSDILAAWEKLWNNNPLQRSAADTVAQHWDALRMDLACAQALAEEALAAADSVPTQGSLDVSRLPTMHTGEEIMAELARQEAQFPLDPYGYDEYNGYFAPEVYDWFVFITDDLSVVYVHENSDIVPDSAERIASLDTPPIDLIASATIAEELATRSATAKLIQVHVQQAVTTIMSGEIHWSMVPQQVTAQLQTVTQPVWDRYVRRNQLFPSERIADLSKRWRF